jgi:hypothetical protein
MVDQNSNDNTANAAGVHRGEPDPHGQAAMLLVESLIHGLIARSLITVTDAIEIVDIASESGLEIAEADGRSLGVTLKSLGLLEAISTSIKWDLPAE